MGAQIPMHDIVPRSRTGLGFLNGAGRGAHVRILLRAERKRPINISTRNVTQGKMHRWVRHQVTVPVGAVDAHAVFVCGSAEHQACL